MHVSDILRQNFITFTKNDTLAKVLGKFRTTGHHHAIIVSDKGIYEGVVSKRRFLLSRPKTDEIKVGKVASRVTRISSDLDLNRLAKCFIDSNELVLPVLDNERVIGIVSAMDLLRSEVGEKLKGMTAAQLATKNPFCVCDCDPVSRVIGLMLKKKIEHVPVLDKKGNVSSIASVVDLMDMFLFRAKPDELRLGQRMTSTAGEKKNVMDLPVGNITHPQMVTCSPSDQSEKIVELFCKNRVHSIIVIEDTRIVGIITLRDLINRLADQGKFSPSKSSRKEKTGHRRRGK